MVYQKTLTRFSLLQAKQQTTLETLNSHCGKYLISKSLVYEMEKKTQQIIGQHS